MNGKARLKLENLAGFVCVVVVDYFRDQGTTCICELENRRERTKGCTLRGRSHGHF